jgi:hypothetical protein
MTGHKNTGIVIIAVDVNAGTESLLSGYNGVHHLTN